MINSYMTDKQNREMFVAKRRMCETYIERLDMIGMMMNKHSFEGELDMELYIAMRFCNYYTQILNEDYGANFNYFPILQDDKWDKVYNEQLRKLEGVDND